MTCAVVSDGRIMNVVAVSGHPGSVIHKDENAFGMSGGSSGKVNGPVLFRGAGSNTLAC